MKHMKAVKEHPVHLLQSEHDNPSPQTPYWSPDPPQISPGPFLHTGPHGVDREPCKQLEGEAVAPACRQARDLQGFWGLERANKGREERTRKKKRLVFVILKC